MKRIVMTGPRAPQWPLAPALRFGAFALLFAAGAMLTKGWWLSFMMWFIANFKSENGRFILIRCAEIWIDVIHEVSQILFLCDYGIGIYQASRFSIFG